MEGKVENKSDNLIRKLEAYNIETQVGIKYCGDIDFYIEILKISVEVSKEKISSLNKFYGEKDYTNYTIIVHSVKSSAANIGAMKLSDMARLLEKAGKEDDIEYIECNNSSFIKCYMETMQGIEDVLGIDNDSVEICEEEMLLCHNWKEMMARLPDLLEELELDVAETIVSEMLSFKLPEEIHKEVVEIKKCLHRFDVEGAKEKVGLLMR
ncbi:MAG: Hpt domain-containing protein [Lachnospiraceae bacterium]|nr:Hpt domain-containing protein [Lachnospiraceae bacterium]